MGLKNKLQAFSRGFFGDIVLSRTSVGFVLYVNWNSRTLCRFLKALISLGNSLARPGYFLLRKTKPTDKTTAPEPLVENIRGAGVSEQEPSEVDTSLGALLQPYRFNDRAEAGGLPIVFIHNGDSEYLQYSLSQAKISNPASTIYLLGDQANDRYDFIEHRNALDYFDAADEFAKNYFHYSPNGYGYELFCFQRWFVLKEFLKANNLDQCLHLDSDVLLYANTSEEKKKFELYDFTLALMHSGHTLYLNNYAALCRFCSFMIEIYAGDNHYHYDKMVTQFALHKKNGLLVRGGASDMTAFELYYHENYGDLCDVCQIIDGSVYDANISTAIPGLRMKDGIKDISWIDGYPYGTHTATGKQIKLNSLHFQGSPAKAHMKSFVRGNLEAIS